MLIKIKKTLYLWFTLEWCFNYHEAITGYTDRRRERIHQLFLYNEILPSDQPVPNGYEIKFKGLLPSLNMRMEQVYNCDKTCLNFKFMSDVSK